MAVLLLMLPAADLAHSSSGSRGAAAGAARTFKLSLSANADLATIEVDGRPPTTTRVQRVYPAADLAARGTGARGDAAVRPVIAGAGPAVPRPRPLSAAPTFDPRDAPLPLRESLAPPDPRARSNRRAPTLTTSRAGTLPPFDPIVYASPNGAPIIE